VAVAGIARTLEDIVERWRAAVVGSAIADDVVREIGVPQRMDERAVPYRERAWFAGGNREVG